MGLVFDENGDVIDVLRLDDMPLEKMVWQYYIQSSGGKVIKFNSSKDLKGMEEMVNVNDATQYYDVSGCSEFVGAPAKIQKLDRCMVIANELGEITHVFIYEREGIETTKMAFCKHCNEEVEWSNWFKSNALPLAGGHYYLEKDITVTSQQTIMDDQKICLDFNGHTVTGTGGTRVYSTFYAGTSLAVMDNSEGTPGRIAYTGKNSDQGNCLWARYGNIDIYDITVDGSQATTHQGGTAVAVESSSIVHMHSGTLIGGETVIVKDKANSRFGATVLVFGQFIMDDGLITGGVADGQGGNVYVGGKGSFTMNGGKITNGRTRNNNGGNVSVAGYNSTFIMNGGTISGGRAIRGEKGTNGAGGNVYVNGTFKMNGGTITDGRCYNWDGTRVENEVRQNMFLVNGDLYMYGGTIKGFVNAVDTNVSDNQPAVIYVSGTAKIKGAPEGGRNLTMSNGVIFRAGTLRKGAEVRVYASGIFSKPTKESNVNFVHSDVPEAQVCYYQECLAIGRFQCLCGAKEGEEHIAATCDGTKLFFGAYTGGNLKQSGNYYMAANMLNAGQVVFGTNTSKDENGKTITPDPITVNFDLNGKTLSGSGRAVLVFGNATVNLSDSVGGGRIEGKGYKDANNAGTMLIFGGATANIYKGVTIGVREDLLPDVRLGGAVQSSGTINMYGGTIQGGHAVDQGGNVHLNGAAVLNMYNDALITGGSSGIGHGGNVFAPKGAKINMYGNAKIVDGTATKQQSGNVYLNGTLTMTDNASISGGKGTHKLLNNVFCVNGDVVVSGDAYLENIQVTNSGTTKPATFKVAGGAKVDGVGLGVYQSKEYPIVEIDGTLTDTAKIVLNGVTGIFTGETVAENADNFVSNDGEAVVYREDEKKLSVGGRYQCICGLDENGEHFGDCDGTKHLWMPWNAVAKQAWPSEAGYWYLVDSGEVRNSLYIDKHDIYLDLNGQTITVAGTYRAFVFQTSDSKYNPGKPDHNIVNRDIEGSLTITDSGENGTVKIEKNSAQTYVMVWNWLDTVKNPELTIYGGHLDCSDVSAKSGPINMGKNAVLTMHGGTITGSTTEGDGGAIYLAAGSKLNMAGGEIIGGSAKRAGAIMLVQGAELNMTGGKITGGEAKEYGGVIFNDGGKLNIANATISGGKAPKGATITTWGTANITNSTINGGVAVRDTANHKAQSGCGSTFFLSAGSLTLDNCIVNSGSVDSLDGTDTNNYGGAAFYAINGNITVKNGSVINGYVNENGELVHSNIRRGGTIFLTGGATMTLEDSTVTASKVAVNAGVLWMENDTNTFTMKGNSKLDASNLDQVTYGGAITLYKGTFNMEGGEIIGTKAGHTLAGGAVALTDAKATFNMSGGTIKGGTATNAAGEGANVGVAAGTFNMTGGEITGGDGKKGGGIYVRSGATLKISGTAKITGNTDSNVMLADGALIEVGTMADGAKIGVTLATGTGIFSSNAVDAAVADADYFVSDNTTYAVERHDGKLAILTPGTGNGDGTGTGGGEGGGNEGGNEGGGNEGGEGQEPTTTSIFHCLCGMKHATSLTDTNPTVKGDCFGDCTGEIHEWKQWDAVAKQAWPSEEGYWYLATSGEVKKTLTIDAADIYLDLNGQTITVTGTYRAFVFQTSESVYNPGQSNHNIVYRDIEGSLTITDSDENGTVKIEENSKQTSAMVWNWLDTVKNPVLNMYGGHLDASNVSSTGAGAINMGKNSVFNMFGGKITGCAAATAHGGTLVISTGSVVNMSGDAEITGGYTSQMGGNLYINGTLNISGNAKIYGGTATQHNDIFCVNGTINASGNAQMGVVGLTSSNAGVASISVADAVKIDSLSLTTYKDASFTGTNVAPTVTINGVLADDDAATTDVNEGALIALNGVKNVFSGVTVADNVNNFVSLDGYTVSINAENKLTVDSSAVRYCMCGASITGAEHALGCSKEILTWTAWNGSNISESGNYYLTGNITKTSQIVINNASKQIIVNINLNGYNITNTKNSERALQIWHDGVLTLSNTKTWGGVISSNGCSQGHALLQMTNWNCNVNHGTTVNMLDRVTLQNTDTTKVTTQSGAVVIGNGGVFNMYGGKIIGGPVTGIGGAFAIGSGCTLNMYGNAEIVGGSAKQGGAIHLATGAKLVMNDYAKITGGTATDRGGSIYMQSAGTLETAPSLVLNDNAVITGGVLDNGGATGYAHGGNLYMGGNRYAQLNDNSSMTNGVAQNNGGNVNLDGAAKIELNDSAAITGGKSGRTNTTAAHADIFSVNGIVTMNGGRVGYLSATNTKNEANKISIRGTAQIDSFSSGNAGGTVSSIMVTGTVDTEKKIFVNMNAGYAIVKRGTLSETEWKAHEVCVDKFAVKDGLKVTFEADGIYIRNASDMIHCVCNAKAGETHLGECTGYDVVWSAWDVTEKGIMPNEPGYWYISKGGEIAATAHVNAGDIYVDLNGQTVTVKNTYRAYIFIPEQDGAGERPAGAVAGSLNFTDSGENGTLRATHTSAFANQGIIVWNWLGRVSNPELNIYGGILDGSGYDSGAAAGTIDLGKNAVINMYGGKIIGNKNAGYGGAVYLSEGSALTMSGDAQIVGGSVTASTNGVATLGGGAVLVDRSSLTMSGNASIINGNAAADGGNVKFYGSACVLTMSDNASITGGKVGENAQDVYSVNAKVVMTGGQIGKFVVYKSAATGAAFELSGDAKIGPIVFSGTEPAHSLTVTALTEGANISVDMAAGYKVVDRGAMSDAQWAAYEAYADNYITTTAGKVVTFEADGIYLRADSDGINPILYHCVCAVDTTPACDCTPVEGVHTAECATQQVVTHLGECKGYDAAWTAWDVNVQGQLPNVSGYYYILGDATNKINKDCTVDEGDHIFLDLNGKTVISQRRVIFYYNGGRAGAMNASYTITDSGNGGTVKRVGGAANEQACLIWNWTDKITNPVLNIYGGHLDASSYNTTKSGAIVFNEGSAQVTGGVINMYGGKVSGAATAANGAAFCNRAGVTLNIAGGEVVGGTVNTAGGAIFSVSALNISNAYIHDGEAKGYGGVIFNDGGTMTVSNATISGGRAPMGATITSWGTVNITDSTINGGVALRNTTAHSGGSGATFYFSGGNTIIDNTVINSGYVNAQDPGDTNNYGGAAIYAAGSSNVTVKNGSVINGYVDAQGNVAASNIRRGGTIFVTANAKITLEDSTVTASKVAVNAGVLWAEGAGNVFTMKGNSKLDASNLSQVTYGGTVTMYKGTFNMEGGEIIGTKAGYTLAGGAVALTDGNPVFNMSGGTITGGTATNAAGEGANVLVMSGTFDMTGGEITGGNGKKGGGVYVRSGATMKISGTARITGNTDSNLMLADGALIQIGTMADGASVGVTMASGTGICSSNVISDADAAFFFSDNTNLVAKKSPTGELAILDEGV